MFLYCFCLGFLKVMWGQNVSEYRLSIRLEGHFC